MGVSSPLIVPGSAARVEALSNALEGASRALTVALAQDVNMHFAEAEDSVSALVRTLRHLLHTWTGRGSFPDTDQGMACYLPAGHVVIRTPASYPLSNGMWAVVPAALTGNRVTWVLPAGCVALAAQIQRVARDAGWPRGDLELVCTEGDEHDLIETLDPRMVVFVGSAEGAAKVSRRADPTGPRPILETGGVNLCVACEAADPSFVIRNVASAMLRHSGQCCNAPTHLLVPRQQAESYRDGFAEILRRVRFGRPGDSSVLTRLARSRYDSCFEATLSRLGRQSNGAIQAPTPPEGFARPTVFLYSSAEDMPEPRSQIGPLLTLVEFDDLSESVGSFRGGDIFSVSVFGTPPRAQLVADMVGEVKPPMLGVDAIVRSCASRRWQGASRSGSGFLLSAPSILQFVRTVSVTTETIRSRSRVPSDGNRSGRLDFDVFLRTAGEETTAAALDALQRESPVPVQVIKGVIPVHRSFNACLDRAREPFFFVVDADVVVFEGALDRMLAVMKSASPDVAIVMPLLRDEFLDDEIYAGFKLYRRDATCGLSYSDCLDDDHRFNAETLPAAGYRVIHLEEVLGVHGIAETSASAYKRGRVRTQKYRLREVQEGRTFGLHKPLIRQLLRWADRRDDRDLAYVLGGVIGLLRAQLDDGSFDPVEAPTEFKRIMEATCKESTD